jgi:hypothetical protein
VAAGVSFFQLTDCRRVRLVVQLLVLAAAFGIGVGLAEVFGAANLGVAFGIGQVCFALALVGVLLRG